MTKGDLIDKVVDEAGISKKAAGEAVQAVLDGITGALKKGQKISLVGFGTFSVAKRAARSGRNPATGATINIPASNVPRFKAGKALKDAVN
jgi:DNA-binding protein HU-beta